MDGDLVYEAGKRGWYNGIMMAAQQISSKMMPLVMPDDEPWEGEMKSMDFISPFDLQEGYTVGADKQTTDATEHKRWYRPRYFADYKLLDKGKIQALANNPANTYITQFNAAARRTTDDVLIDALDAPSFQGADGPFSQVAFPTTQVIPHGSKGLTKRKILDALSMFKKADLDDDATAMGLTLSCIFTEAEERHLLLDDKLISADYLTHRFLIDGGISPTQKTLGVNFHRTNRLDRTLSGGIQRCYIFRRDAVMLSWPQPITPTFRIADEKQRSPYEIGMEMQPAAGRTLDELVVAIEIDVSAQATAIAAG